MGKRIITPSRFLGARNELNNIYSLRLTSPMFCSIQIMYNIHRPHFPIFFGDPIKKALHILPINYFNECRSLYERYFCFALHRKMIASQDIV